MGSGFGRAVGFFYLWPLMFLITIAVYVCLAYTKPESNGEVLTDGGKRMVRSRLFLGVGCAVYYLCVTLGVAFKSGGEPMLVLGFWDMHRDAFLTLIIGAQVSMLIATVYSFRARGHRTWVIQIATVLVAISSALVTLLFLSPG